MTRSARALRPPVRVGRVVPKIVAAEVRREGKPRLTPAGVAMNPTSAISSKVLWRSLSAGSMVWPSLTDDTLATRLIPILLATVLITAPVLAQTAAPPPLPPIDLGQTNILDAEGKPGGLLEVISLGSFANRLTNGTGDNAPGRNRQRIASLVMHRAVNTGQGAWQISPYLAVTWRASDRWEVSARAIYDRTGSSPSTSPTGEPIGIRPGDIFALNGSISYAITDKLRLGPGGYVLKQLSDSRSAGEPIVDSRAQIFALGPVSRLQVGQATLLLAAFGEFAARNRPQGASLNLRLQHPL